MPPGEITLDLLPPEDHVMLRWDKLVDTELYVLDLTQRDDGLRRIKIRLASDDPHDRTVFVSQKYDGKSLCDCDLAP